MSIERVKENICVDTSYDGANVACIQTGVGLVLVDTPMLPKDIRNWQAFISGVDGGEVRCIVATHHHYDHIIGNHAMGGRVLMHADAYAKMRTEGATLREDMAPTAPGRTQEEVDFILSAPLTAPEMTFSDEMTLYLGDVVLRLVHVGGHCPGSICIYAENEKVLFTGDVMTAGNHPYKGDGNFAQWIDALRWMKTLDIERIVPGHGEVCGSFELDRFYEYFTRLWLTTEKMVCKGRSKEDVVKNVHESLFGYFEVDPERLDRAKVMFDTGTMHLYEEILAGIEF